MEVIVILNKYSQDESLPARLPEETVRYWVECLYTAQTVGLPLIHTVLDFG